MSKDELVLHWDGVFGVFVNWLKTLLGGRSWILWVFSALILVFVVEEELCMRDLFMRKFENYGC